MTSQCTAATSRRTQQARICAFAIAAMTVSLSTPVIAETSYYGGAQFAVLKHVTPGGSLTRNGTTVSSNDITLDYTAIIGRLGAQFHENLSVEARVGFGVSGDSTDVLVTANGGTSLVAIDVDLKSIYGGYLRAGIPAGKLYPYLIAGWTEAEIERSVGSSSSDDSNSDFSYGIGTDILISDNVSANLELVKVYDKGNTEVGGFLIGVIASF